MAEADGDGRFYGELAEWWPLISPPEEYAEEAAVIGDLLAGAARPVREVLELGSGGGHVASHLTGRFAMTLLDRSPEMLAVSRRRNPGASHHVGDMRSARLPRAFDAVLVHDAIAYMLTRDDLAAAIGTAFVHCRPGGRAVLVPDETAESFAPTTTAGGADAPDGRGARYLEWSRDPDPGEDVVPTEYAFLLREVDGTVRAVHETHRSGCFSREVWLATLAGAGFAASAVPEPSADARPPREIFVGDRPA